ncbi:MAG TPA: hypothetical protein VNF51_00555 [Candidatus Paceibacterota bacterium]|nr:hypothetical protein [Candidatus Paceibacterota bacterium]
MKRFIAVVVALSILLSGCGHPLNTERMTYPTYGLFNENSDKSKNVCYEISAGNVVWSIILIETIVFPVYFIGWSIYNPVRMKRGPDDQCTFDS